MAADCIADGLAQSIEIVGFGEDRMAEGARHEAVFRRFFDREDDLAFCCTHEGSLAEGMANGQRITPPAFSSAPR